MNTTSCDDWTRTGAWTPGAMCCPAWSARPGPRARSPSRYSPESRPSERSGTPSHDPRSAAAPALRLPAEPRAATGRRCPAAERALPWWQSRLTELAEAILRYRSGRRAAEFEALRRLLDTALADATLT
ncbi:hypothetical protein [Streptomyces ossamyceticus]|uniref:hypothetical protein n=1 Tax=Streptomyces ossamyceticus TaxID=249581 RepID=UPI0012FEDD5D|nr:hypothetical protein [Streptomyces ossamyceticus]